MKNDVFQKLIYQLVSKLFVLPIYKFVFRGHLIGRENIPQKNSFIMVSNHGSLLDPPLSVSYTHLTLPTSDLV